MSYKSTNKYIISKRFRKSLRRYHNVMMDIEGCSELTDDEYKLDPIFKECKYKWNSSHCIEQNISNIEYCTFQLNCRIQWYKRGRPSEMYTPINVSKWTPSRVVEEYIKANPKWIGNGHTITEYSHKLKQICAPASYSSTGLWRLKVKTDQSQTYDNAILYRWLRGYGIEIYLRA